MVNLNRLHCFYVCAQAKQITKAATTLGVSQPSLSQQIKNFEQELGFDLFVRSSKSFELTEKGKVLFEKSAELFDCAQNITHFVEKKKNLVSPNFTIAVSDEIERPFVAEIVGKLLKTKKGSAKKFFILSKEHNKIAEQFKNEAADLFLTTKPIESIKPAMTFDFPIMLVTSLTPKKHLKSDNVKMVFKTLQQNLVLPSSELSFREDIQQFLKEKDLDIPVIFESNIFACVTRAIKEGVGCGFVPLPYVLSDSRKEQLSIIGPNKGFWQKKIYLYVNERTDSVISENINQIIYSYIP